MVSVGVHGGDCDDWVAWGVVELVMAEQLRGNADVRLSLRERFMDPAG